MSNGLRHARRMRRTAGTGLALCLLVGYAALTAGPAQARSAGAALVPPGGSAPPAGSWALPAGSPTPASTSPPPAGSWALPAGARVLGPAPRSARLPVTLTLRSRDPGGLARLARKVALPRDPGYRHFLRAAQVTARFGAPRAVLAAVRAWLRGRGLRVGATLGDGLLLPASGPAGALEAAFRTPIVRVRLASGRVAYANRRAITLPVRLRHWVTAVVGLSNVILPWDYLAGPGRPASPARSASPAPDSAGPRACAAARETPAAFTADQLAYAYQFRGLFRRGELGRGVTVALFEQADYSDRDIRTYQRCYGIHPSVRRVRVDGGTTISASPAGTIEATSDIETVIGMAPQVHVLVYEAPFDNGLTNTLDNYGAIASQDRAQVVSSSYGYCEPAMIQGGKNVAHVEAAIFQEMAVQGQSMLAASGDAGSEQCLPFVSQIQAAAYQLKVGDPASQPFVTAVGGTEITRLTSPPVEAAWNQSGPDGNGAGWAAPFDGMDGRPAKYPGNDVGDGGISEFWTMPAWQRGFDTSGNSSGAPCGAPAGTDCREVPDVSALAAGGAAATPGYAIYGTAGGFKGHGWVSVGGTSLAAPLWAALTALADHRVRSGRLGLLSPALYFIGQHDPLAFSDVTRGDNNYLAADGAPSNFTCRYHGAAGQPCYEATPGYDMATGLGSPRAWTLAADLAAVH